MREAQDAVCFSLKCLSSPRGPFIYLVGQYQLLCTVHSDGLGGQCTLTDSPLQPQLLLATPSCCSCRQADSPPGSPSAAGEEASLSRFHRTLGTTPTPTYAQVLMSGASLPPGTRRGVLFSPCAGSLSGQGSEAPAPGGRGSRLWQPPRPPLSEQALLQQQEQQHSADQALRGVSPGSLQHSVAAALAAAEAAGGMPPESPSAASSR